MTAQRMKWLLLGVPGIVLFTWTTLAVQQQVKKIDDKALKDRGKRHGMAEQRDELGRAALQHDDSDQSRRMSANLHSPGRMNSVPVAATSRRLLSIRTASSIP